MEFGLNPQLLIGIVTDSMPFGKYKGTKLYCLPVSYLEWFERNGGFPSGKLGQQLQTLHVIKTNGLEEILQPLIRAHGG